MLKRLLLIAACWGSFVACSDSSQPTARLSELSANTIEPTDLDQLIAQRISGTLNGLRSNPYHKNKSVAELEQLARVGKATPQGFKDRLQQTVQENRQNLNEAEFSALQQEYRRIWYLADNAYKVTRSKKFDPKPRLIPYLQNKLPQPSIIWLLPIFRAELEQESKDPRALGAECSEMFKLQAIVDTLQARAENPAP